MVNRIPLNAAIIFALSLLLIGCGPRVGSRTLPGFAPPTDTTVAYIIPFTTTLVPDTFSDSVFSAFVDELNDQASRTGIRSFLIIKEDPATLDRAWLTRQVYFNGDIWSYIEKSGCCSTEMRVSAKVSLYQPGLPAPTLEIFAPIDSFFDHDGSTLPVERNRLAMRLAREMAARVIQSIAITR